MSKQIEKKLVPELRFPEFWNTGTWDEIRFFDVADKKIKWSFIGGPFGSNLKSSDYVEEGVRIIQLQNIGDAEFKDKYKIFTSEEKANELLSNNIYPGDIILSKMGDPVGRACLIPDIHTKYVMCSDGIRLVVDEMKHSKYFIYSLINSIPYRSLIEKTATGSTRKRIGLSELKNLPMLVPELKEEQQKIADCLYSIDDLITAHAQKHDALKAYKKGLMQQLFPAVGETVPKLRFPEFVEDWFQTDLSQYIKLISGMHLAPNEYQDSDAGDKIPYFTGPSDFVNNMSEVSKWTSINKSFASSGDTLLTVKGSGVGQIMFLELAKVAMGRQLMAISATPDTGKFIFYCLALKKQYFEGLASGNMIPGLARPGILKTRMFFPKNNKEQKKIADFLSSIDELITTQAKKIETLKAHKKGLMQRLFPTTDDDCMDAEGRATQDAKAGTAA